MEGTLSSFAEFDNSIRTERCVNGMKERIKQGIWVWGAHMGYLRLEKGANLSIDTKYAPYIVMTFENYAKGTYSYESLAKYLTARGCVTRQGRPMTKQLVEKIIKNPIYCGIIRVWDMEYKGKFEPLISEDFFYQCQGGGRKRIHVPHLKENRVFPLRKLAVCQHCNQPITGSKSTGRKGKKYPYYQHHKQTCDHPKGILRANVRRIPSRN